MSDICIWNAPQKVQAAQYRQWEFESARAVAAALERASSWRVAVQEAHPAEEPRTTRITIEDATDAFLAKSRSRSIAPNTLAKYRTFTNQMEFLLPPTLQSSILQSASWAMTSVCACIRRGRPLFTWIPDWLVERLLARHKVHGALIFAAGVT